jgi:N-acetylmuramoyl-L-alanine amidase
VSKLTKKYGLVFSVGRYLLTAFLLIPLAAFSPASRQRHFSVTRVVIDAGHGGHDSGCLGKKSMEKDIALGVALKLGKYIEENFSDVKVIYTRKTDTFVELFQRAAIANNAKADLFICIHCNSACFMDKKKREICNEESSGPETWVMGLHKSEANLEVSKRENSVVLLEKDYLHQYDGFDPNSPEANIIFSLYQNTYLDQSLRLASYVQQELKLAGRTGRGVKQAGFIVLYKTSMPSILVETGFLSNPDEEQFLISDKGQHVMARSIFNAFRSYKNSVESGSVKTETREQETVVPPKDTADKNATSLQSATDSTAVAAAKPDSDKVVQATKTQGEKGDVKGSSQTASAASGQELIYRVQFLISPSAIPKGDKRFKGIKDVREEKEKKTFKYTSGQFNSMEEAAVYQEKLRSKGFKDAFVVAYRNGKRISINEAKESDKKK